MEHSRKNGLLGGRPSIEVDFPQLEAMMGIGATAEECAGFFKMSVDTLDTKMKAHYGLGFSECVVMYDCNLNMSLRRKQIRLALDGNGHAGMLIWLGKQRLKQTDKQEMTMTDLKPIKLQYALEEPKQQNYIDTEVVSADNNQSDKITE